MAAGPVLDRNQDATVYVGGLDEKVTEPILWELFVQAGPVVSVHMPKDRITTAHQGYGFVEFMGEEDADYAIKIMNMIKLFGKPIRVNKASAHQKNLDVGANIFIGNLDPEVDEKLLYDTFSAFGVILQVPKIMRDPDTGNSKGFAFVNFASFEASDSAMEAMNGQYLCNRPISVSYAFKKDAKGERHGTAAERLLAAQNPLFPTDRPHQLFADAPALPPPMPSMFAPPPPAQTPMGGMMPGQSARTPMPPPPPPSRTPQMQMGQMGQMPPQMAQMFANAGTPRPPMNMPTPPPPPPQMWQQMQQRGMFPPLPPRTPSGMVAPAPTPPPPPPRMPQAPSPAASMRPPPPPPPQGGPPQGFVPRNMPQSLPTPPRFQAPRPPMPPQRPPPPPSN